MTMTTTQDEAARIDALQVVVVADKLNERDESFARSLIDSYEARGYLSEKQWPWVDKLTARGQPQAVELTPQQKSNFTKYENARAKLACNQPGFNPGEFAAIADFFAAASKSPTNPKGLVHPKLKFDLAFIDESWRGDLLLKRAGEQSRYPGAINVTNGMPFGDAESIWYGRIHKDGRFEASRDCTAIVRGVLIAIDADPAKIATAYGRMSCTCCFCFAKLTDEKDNRSVAQGYGPVCATRYGLPWG